MEPTAGGGAFPWRKETAMTEISTTPQLTLINTFTVAPDKQDELIALLDTATAQVMQNLPGFVSANIHRSLDGKRVVNYAQWRSKADFEAMQKNPEAGAHMQKAAALAEKIDPVLYEVESVFDRAA
jgi:quinol monooxygenase YgiN